MSSNLSPAAPCSLSAAPPPTSNSRCVSRSGSANQTFASVFEAPEILGIAELAIPGVAEFSSSETDSRRGSVNSGSIGGGTEVTAEVPFEIFSDAPPSQLGEKSLHSKMISSGSKSLKGSRLSLQDARTTTLNFVEDAAPSWVKVSVDSNQFSILCSLMIFANAIYIGFYTNIQLKVEIDRSHLSSEEDSAFFAAEWIFCSWFTFELVLRFFGGPVDFVTGPDWHWNMFDFALVLNCLVEQLLVGMASNYTFVRILRIVRMVRILRIIRVMRFFRSLRIMAMSIISSLVSLLWVFILMLILIYLFAIFLTSEVLRTFTENNENDSPMTQNDAVLVAHFGSVPEALVTLFESICGGLNWHEVYKPLLDRPGGIWAGVVFIMYVFFVYFGVLNVVTGAFVDSMRQVSEKDRDHVVELEMKRIGVLKRNMTELFTAADTDESGSLCWEEFEAHLGDARVQAYFRTLEIDVSQARALFVLLDLEESDEVPIDRFVEGCMRMRGDAKSIDVNMLLFENQKIFIKMTSFIEYAEDKFDRIEQILTKIRATKDGTEAYQNTRRPSFSMALAAHKPQGNIKSQIDTAVDFWAIAKQLESNGVMDVADAATKLSKISQNCEELPSERHKAAGKVRSKPVPHNAVESRRNSAESQGPKPSMSIESSRLFRRNSDQAKGPKPSSSMESGGVSWRMKNISLESQLAEQVGPPKKRVWTDV
jgi:hypothetical protein